MEKNNLKIIGSSHIAKQSLDEVREAFDSFKPDIVALELDRQRLYALMNKDQAGTLRLRDIGRVGIKGYIFSLIGHYAEKKMGQIVGVAPGSEMKLAAELAVKNKAQIALIDRPIEKTLKRFSKKLTWKEKWRFFADIVKAAFGGKQQIPFDLAKVPAKEVIRDLVAKVKDRYPNVYSVLISERNSVMASKLERLMIKEPEKKILAVVGAGHVDGISKLLFSQEISYSVSFG